MLKLLVIGRLGKDAEQKEINGNSVIDFPLIHVTRHRSKESAGKVTTVEKLTWINCSYWVDAPKLLEFLKKGVRVYLEGTPDVSGYTKDGVAMGSLRLKVAVLELVGGRIVSAREGHADEQTEENDDKQGK